MGSISLWGQDIPITPGEWTTQPDAIVNGSPYWNPSDAVNPNGMTTPGNKIEDLVRQNPNALTLDAQNPASNPVFKQPIEPAQDPAFLAFQRALQVNEDNMRADIAKRMATESQRLATAEPGFQTQLSRGLQGIGNDYAGRGAWSSSARLNAENNLQQDVGQSRANLQQEVASNQGDLQSQLLRSLATGQMDSVTQENASRDRLGAQRAQTQADAATNWENALGRLKRSYLTGQQ